jgi:hypothetical protein
MKICRKVIVAYFIQKSGKRSYQLIERTGKEKPRSVNKHSQEALQLGFKPDMSYEEARVRIEKIKAEEWVQRHEQVESNRTALRNRLKMYRNALIPDLYATEFEEIWLNEHNIRVSHWNTLQKIIYKIPIHPTKWFKQPSLIYKQFEGYRHGYYKKLLRYLNIWGYFVCEKEGKAWKDVPMPGPSMQLKLEAKAKFRSSESLPLTFEKLAETKNKWLASHYNWLFISIAFGLRPREVNNLLSDNPELYRLTEDKEHGWVLEVFQEKLRERKVPKNKCWKYIPTVLPEQRLAVLLIQFRAFRQPSRMKFQQVLGLGYSGYAGRKNFVQLLKDAGYDLFACRDWMGHLSIKTTEKSYETRGKVSYHTKKG